MNLHATESQFMLGLEIGIKFFPSRFDYSYNVTELGEFVLFLLSIETDWS